ncbi:MAG TPA: DUF6230 family protein [Streptosporangiaceae bacterium]|jgi:hypothetical protein|nr:DUF6230 family protein [Streptosporangiaceae bacterium]
MTSLGQTVPIRFGRVRWRRFTFILAPAIFLVFLLLMLTAQSVLAVSLNISGRPFTVTAQVLHGRGFEQFGILDHSFVTLPGHRSPLAATAMRSATISHLCQAVNVGGVSMIITAGNGSTPVSATNLVVFADRFSGNASFTHLMLGRDASTLHAVPGLHGPVGAFSLAANTVTITHLRQHAFATVASTFTLPGFRLRFGGSC